MSYISKGVSQLLKDKTSSSNTNNVSNTPYTSRKTTSDYIKQGISDVKFNKNEYIAKANQDTIKGLQDNLSSNGVDYPAQAQPVQKKWYEKLFDPISAGQYSLAHAFKNVADDNPNTGFFQGLKQGWQAGFDSQGNHMEDRTSWKEVLDSLLNSNNSTKQNITAVANNIINPFAWGDALDSLSHYKGDTQTQVDVAKQHTGLTGFAGDMLLDPLNLVGVGEIKDASKVLLKGTKILKAGEDVSGVEKATKILKDLGNTEDLSKNAVNLANKTDKALGYVPKDFKGITIGTAKHNIPIVSAETLGKIGDSKLTKIITTPINKFTDAVGSSNTAKDVKAMFGGQYGKLMQYAKDNPSKAMDTIAFIDMQKKLANKEMADKLRHIKTTQEIQSVLKDHEVQVTHALEAQKTIDTIKEVSNVPNEERAAKIQEVKGILKAQIVDVQKQLDDLAKKSAKSTNLAEKMSIQKEYNSLNDVKQMKEVASTMTDKEFEQFAKGKLDNAKAQIGDTNIYGDMPKETPKAVTKTVDESLRPSNLLKKEDNTKGLNDLAKVKSELRDLKWSINPENRFSKAPTEKYDSIKKRIEELNKYISDNKVVKGETKITEAKPKATQEEINKMIDISNSEVVKSNVDNKLQDTYKEVGNRKLNDLSEKTYNNLLEAHKNANLPLTEEIKNRYKSMNEWEAKQEIDFLNKKVSNQRKLNLEHTVQDKLNGNKSIGINDYITKLSEKAKVKPRFDINSEDYFTANQGFRNIEKARLERKLFEKGNTKFAPEGKITDSMARQLSDALASTFKDSKWIANEGDNLTKDLKHLTKNEFDSVWNSVKKANNKPYESKSNILNWKTENKNFSNEGRNSEKEANALSNTTGKDTTLYGQDRSNWSNQAYEKTSKQNVSYEDVIKMMENNDSALNSLSDNFVQSIIERNMSKEEQLKEAKQMRDEYYKSLPPSEKQLNGINKVVANIKQYRPEIYTELKKTFNGSFRNIKTREDVNKFFDTLNSFGNTKLDSKLETKLRKSIISMADNIINTSKDTKALEDANKIKELFSKGKVASYNQYLKVKEGLNAHIIKDKINTVLSDNVENKVAELKNNPKAVVDTYNVVDKTPKEELEAAVSNIEDKSKVIQLKNTTDKLNNAINESVRTVVDKLPNSNEILQKQLERKLTGLTKTLEDEATFNKAFEKKYGKDYPKFTQITLEKQKSVSDLFSEIDDPKIKEMALKIQSDFKDMGTKEGVNAIDNYVPHILNPQVKDKIPFGDTKIELKNPTNQHAKSREVFGDMSIKEINDYMLEKHGIENYMEDKISRIYLERALSHDTYMFEKKSLDNFVNTFGTQFNLHLKPQKGDKEGWKTWWAQKNKMDNMIKESKYSIVKLDDNYKPVTVTSLEGDSLERALNQGLTSSPFIEVNRNDLQNENFFAKNKQPIYLIPVDMHKNYLDVMKGQYKQSSNTLLKMYKNFHALWKAQALFSTSYHVNNIIGNFFNGYLDVGAKIASPKYNTYSILALTEKGNFLGKSGAEWKKIATESGLLDHGYHAVDLKAFRSGELDVLKNTENPIKKFIKAYNPLTISQTGGEFIEQQARLTNFFIHIANGKSVQEATELTNKFLFDYTDLSSFEQGVMKNVMPFYTWFRKNLPLQVSQLLDQPQKFGKVYRAQKDVSKPETDIQANNRPDYLDGAIHLGNGNYYKANFPYNDLAKATSPKELISGMNPFAKLALELLTNKNIYFNSPIESTPGQKTKAPLYLEPFATQTPKGDMIGAKTKYTTDTLFPAIKNVSNALNVLLGNGNESDVSKAQGFTTGIRTYNVDPEKQKQQAIQDYIQKLKDIETNAKSEGKLTNTAEQIKKQKDAQAQYDKISEIYNKSKAYVDNIYKNNYVIPKKKKSTK